MIPHARGAPETVRGAPSTVKKHLENIYDKIGARNRTEAIARAQELALL